MTLPISGAIQFSDINTELGRSATAQLSINDSEIRTTFGQASGAVDLNTGHGKTGRIKITVNVLDYSAEYDATPSQIYSGNYQAGKSDVTFVITTGSIISAPGVSSYAFKVRSAPWAAGDTVTVINNYYVVGYAGKGGDGANGAGGSGGGNTIGGNGGAGGPAVYIERAVTWVNNGTVGGGGGGGAGGGSFNTFNGFSMYQTAGGGGGGGGQGGGAAGSRGTGDSPGTAGNSGLFYSTGAGGAGGTFTNAGGTAVGQTGGAGGAYGQPGASATGGSGPDGLGYSGTPGAAGACLVGKTYVNSGAGITGGTVAGAQS